MTVVLGFDGDMVGHNETWNCLWNDWF